MEYYIASIHKGDPRKNNFELIEHYHVVRSDEDIKEKIISSIKQYKDEREVNRVDVYKHEFTIYDDELDQRLKGEK